MSMSLPAPSDYGRRDREESNSGFWLAFLLLTLVSVGCGSLMATYLMEAVEPQAAESVNAQEAAALQYDAYTTNSSIREMRPLVTNLDAPRDAWVRIAGVLVLGDKPVEDVDLLIARVEEDILTYLRSVTLAQLEGAVGLQHLREDLNERARFRSEGAVREVILQSLVIQ